jgi:hypothetical protein
MLRLRMVPVLVCSSGLWAPLWWWVCCKLVSARDRRRRRGGRRRRRRTMPMSKAQRRAPRRGRRGIVKARTKSVFKRCLLDITSAHFTFHLQACVVSMRFHCCLLPVACCLLPVACCLLPVACCLLPVACCLLPVAYCLLPVARCLLPVALTTKQQKSTQRV